VRIHGQRCPQRIHARRSPPAWRFAPRIEKDEGIVPRAAVTETIAIARRNIKNQGSLFVDFHAETTDPRN